MKHRFLSLLLASGLHDSVNINAVRCLVVTEFILSVLKGTEDLAVLIGKGALGSGYIAEFFPSDDEHDLVPRKLQPSHLDVVAVHGIGSLRALSGSAGAQSEHHGQSKQQRNAFFHFSRSFLFCYLRTALNVLP